MIYVNLFLLFFSLSFQKQYSGFLVSEIDKSKINTFVDLCGMVFIFLVWCVANWSITTLMNGEGKFVEIAMATAYSFTPLILTIIPFSIISNFMVKEEVALYYLAISIATAWFLLLAFMGIYTVHAYTVGKAAKTVLLTIVAAAIILFIMVMFLSLFQQMFVFLRSIYIEIIFRF